MKSRRPPIASGGSLKRFATVVIGALGLLGLLAGVVLGGRGEPTATATTPILVNPLEGNPFYPSSRGEQLVNLETEAQALRSEDVASLVALTTGSDEDPSSLLGGVDVVVPVNTQILEVSYTSRDPDTATELSQAFAESYLVYRAQRAETRIDEQVVQIDEQIAEFDEELSGVTFELAATPEDTAAASLLEQRADALAAQINTLSSRTAELVGSPLDAGSVVTAAALGAPGPLDSQFVLPIAGLVAGLGAGAALVLIRARREERLVAPEDVLEAGVTLLGTVGWWDGAVAPGERPSRLGDEVRKACVSILAREPARPFSMLLASGGPEPVHAGVAVELANAFTRGGFETIVVDTTGTVHARSTELDRERGLSEVLLGRSSLGEELTDVAPQTWLLPPGPRITAAADLFVSNQMRQLMRELRDRCDVVIVVASTAHDSFGQSLAAVVDAVAVEVTSGEVSRAQLRYAIDALGILNESVLGAVLLGEHAGELPTRFVGAVHQRTLPVRSGLPALVRAAEAVVSGDYPPEEVSDPSGETATADQIGADGASDAVSAAEEDGAPAAEAERVEPVPPPAGSTDWRRPSPTRDPASS